MAKTIKQIADELGISKQKVYRYVVKNHINEVHQEVHQKNDVKYYDEVAEALIKQGFQTSEVHQEVHQENASSTSKSTSNDAQTTSFDVVMKQNENLIAMLMAEREKSETLIESLRNELETKNKQIDEKDKQITFLENLIASEKREKMLLLEKNEASGVDQVESVVDVEEDSDLQHEHNVNDSVQNIENELKSKKWWHKFFKIK